MELSSDPFANGMDRIHRFYHAPPPPDDPVRDLEIANWLVDEMPAVYEQILGRLLTNEQRQHTIIFREEVLMRMQGGRGGGYGGFRGRGGFPGPVGFYGRGCGGFHEGRRDGFYGHNRGGFHGGGGYPGGGYYYEDDDYLY